MSVQSSSTRSLAPAPASAATPIAAASTDSNDSSSSAVFNSSAAGIKRASTACRSCKQIKRKCDQALPCSNCRKSHTRCIYNEAEDGRRKAARKRTVESLELKRDALDSILESLRTSDDRHVQVLLQLIRSQAPLEEIVQYATTHVDTLSDDQLREITITTDAPIRRTVLSVTDLCDTPLVRVPSKPWTDVTADDEFVSHLISLFFTWFHVAYPVVDRDLFLRDMSAGEPNCQFCSPLLVNAMLTMACHFSDHPRACQTLSDPNTRGRHFLDEATRLWSEQEGRPELLNIQALSILAVSSTLIGKDRLSWSYLVQLNAMQQELHFKTNQRSRVAPEMSRSQQLTLWTTFVLTVGYGSAFMKPSMATLPKDLQVLLDPIVEQNLAWCPYPRREPELDIPFDDLFKAYCSLHTLGLEIQQLQLGKNVPANPTQESMHIDRALQEWRRNLPTSLEIYPETSVIKPPIMDLYLTYYWFRNNLFAFVKTPQSNPATPPDRIDPFQLHARSQTIESAKAVAELCRRYAWHFGLKQQLTMWMPQTALSAAHSLIDALSNQTYGSEVQDIFHELCFVLVAASQRWLVMKGHVRMLFMTAEEKGANVPKRTTDLLKFVALDMWGETDHLQFASASYPNYALAKDDDPRLAAMGDLLEKWASFHTNQDDDEIVTSVEESYRGPLVNMNERSSVSTER